MYGTEYNLELPLLNTLIHKYYEASQAAMDLRVVAEVAGKEYRE